MPSLSDYDELNLTGLEISPVSLTIERLTASFGQGYGASASIGTGSGLWGWELSSDCLPDDPIYQALINGVPRFQYYTQFYLDHTEGDAGELFVIDFRGRKFLVSFADDSISGNMQTYDLFDLSGIKLKMRRVKGMAFNPDGSIDTTPRTLHRIDVGRTSGGTIAGWEDDSAFGTSGTITTASPTGGWDTSGLLHPGGQSVYDTVRYGSVGLSIPGLTPFAPYTLRIICGWDGDGGVVQTDVTINGHAHGSILFPDRRVLVEGVYNIVADSSGVITIACTTGSVFALVNAVVLTEASMDFATANFEGNSITLSIPLVPPTIWFRTCGMAASVPDKDYVHQLASMLPTLPIFTAHYDLAWETAHHTFTLSTYDSHISQDLNILRIGENVTDYANLQADMQAWVAHIRSIEPHSRIIVTGEYWVNATIEAAFEAAAKAEHVLWITFVGVDTGTRWSSGKLVIGDDGLSHALTDSGVLAHPTDSEHLRIAQRIFENMSTPPALTNWALASNGSTASASSTETTPNPLDHPASRVIDGYRNTNGIWDSPSVPGSAWKSVTNSSEWLEVDFGTTRSIQEIDVFTLADALTYTANPSIGDTFTLYGVTDFDVQYWNGATWTTVSSVTGNNHVWNRFTFSAVSTTKIRISGCHSSVFSACVIVELEAWG
jgi:hypothetical protein